MICNSGACHTALTDYGYSQFAAMVEAAGLKPRQCGRIHWQICGSDYLVNYYPSRNKVYVNGMAEGFLVADTATVLSIAKNGPPHIGKRADRRKKYRRIKKHMLTRSSLCHWCRLPLTLDTATLDHRIPLARGGADQPDNWVLACEPCNRKRGNQLGAPKDSAQ